MVKIITRYDQLNMRQYLDVMEDSIHADAEIIWFHRPIESAILCEEQSVRSYLLNHFFGKEDCVCLVWEEDGVYVSALRMEPFRDGLILTALETKPDCRRRGYAQKLVQSAMEYAAGRKVYAHISKKNKASLALHKKAGFQKILDHAVYLDGDISTSSITMCYGE